MLTGPPPKFNGTRDILPEHARVVLFDPASVTVTRYRYRGNVATPWAEPATA